MTSYTPEDIEKALKKLPDALRETVFAQTTNEKVLSIGKRYGLNIEQSGLLLTNVRLVMIGILTPEEFKSELIATQRITVDTASKITADVSTEVVQHALSGLRENQEETPQSFTDEEIEALLAEEDEEISEEEGEHLAASGIEVISQPTVPDNTPTESLSRETLLENIQNPSGFTKTVPTAVTADEIQRGITGEKLAGNFKIPGEQKDYSVNKSAEPTPTSIKVIRHHDRVDPYREPFE